MSYGKIKDIKTEYYRLPLEGNLGDALHGKHDNFELVVTKVLMESGIEGVGYTYTGGFGGRATAEMLRVDLAPSLIGKELDDTEKMHDFMNTKIHYVARGGIASFAISALDISFWDIKLKSEKKALADYFGTKAAKVRTYYGGIDLMFTNDELVANVEKQLASGHTAIKIKVGRANEDEDVERIRLIRELLGKDALFMVDANMVWSREQAIRMARKIEKYNIGWLEEPTNPDDYEGYARIAQATSIPIAMGENLHTVWEHKLALDIGKLEEPILDASNLCGLTGVFRVAKIAKDYSLRASTHGMQELHVNALAAIENRGLLEFHSFPIFEYTKDPIKVVDGYVAASTEIGTGVNFDWDKLNKLNMA